MEGSDGLQLINSIKLYVDWLNQINTGIKMYQGDEKVHYFDIQLFNKVTPYDLTDINYISLVFKKADGNITTSKSTDLQSRIVITDVVDGKFTYNLGSQDYSYAGEIICVVSLHDGDGERLSSNQFSFTVLPYLDNDGQATTSMSVNSFNGRLTYLESQIEPQYPRYYDLISSASIDIGTLTGSTINTITDSTKNWIANQFINKVVKIYNGTYDYGIVLSNTATTITFDASLTTIHTIGMSYKIIHAYELQESDMDIMISADSTLNDCALILPQVNSNNNRRTVEMYLEKGDNHFVNICKNADRQAGQKYGVLLFQKESVTLKSHNYIPNHYDIFSTSNISRWATGYWSATEDVGGLNVFAPIGDLTKLVVDGYRRFTPVNKSGKSWMKYNSLFPRTMKLTGNYKLIKTGAGVALLDFALIKYDASTNTTSEILTRISTVKQDANDIFTVSFSSIVDLEYNDEIAVICKKDTDTFTMQIGSSQDLREI